LHPGPLRRRDLLKLGAGVVGTALAGRSAGAQAPRSGEGGSQSELHPYTGAGYVNDYDRLSANGPIDDTTRKIVTFVRQFKTGSLTVAAIQALNRTMVDSAAAMVAAFEEDAVRVAARLARLSPAGELTCTVLGYGISTTPELAAFANGCMIRVTDFNDNGPGGHTSDLIPAALALGEALHSSGADVLTAIAIGYEISGAPAGGESVRAAMVAGRLLGLDAPVRWLASSGTAIRSGWSRPTARSTSSPVRCWATTTPRSPRTSRTPCPSPAMSPRRTASS
jgi:hypothetical protein